MSNQQESQGNNRNKIKKENESPSGSPILVEFTDPEGVRAVGIFSRGNEKELAEKSNGAIERAMANIQKMSNKVNSTIKEMDGRPDSVEVEFGIKFDAELGVIIAKASIEASMLVKLAWNSKNATGNVT
jgi:hypothetical protein